MTTMQRPAAPATAASAPTAALAPRCLECDAPLEGRFCAECGQRADTGRLHAGAIARETVGRLVDVDSALLRTLRDLLRRPHVVAREYIAGRRVRYTDPFRYYLYAVALNISMRGLLDLVVPGERAAAGAKSGLAGVLDSSFVALQISVVFMLLLVPVAVGLRHFHRTRPENATEHYAFLLYGMTLAVLGLMTTDLVLALVGRRLGGWDGALWLGLVVAYVLAAGRRFYALSWGRTVVMTLVALLWAALGFVLVGGALALTGIAG